MVQSKEDVRNKWERSTLERTGKKREGTGGRVRREKEREKKGEGGTKVRVNTSNDSN